jgi:hypothetical protein
MCVGCFQHLLADARLKDEQATCPNCRCEISKNLCSRNLAVEKMLLELPATCQYCNYMYSRNTLDNHEKNECVERLTKCNYECIGCTWEGPYHELSYHSEQCGHPNKESRQIINFLKERDAKFQEEQQSLMSFIGLLSYEKMSYHG